MSSPLTEQECRDVYAGLKWESIVTALSPVSDRQRRALLIDAVSDACRRGFGLASCAEFYVFAYARGDGSIGIVEARGERRTSVLFAKEEGKPL